MDYFVCVDGIRIVFDLPGRGRIGRTGSDTPDSLRHSTGLELGLVFYFLLGSQLETGMNLNFNLKIHSFIELTIVPGLFRDSFVSGFHHRLSLHFQAHQRDRILFDATLSGLGQFRNFTHI